MSLLPLVVANLRRKRFRTLFTLLSIFVAFVLFGVLIAIRTAFGQGIDLAGLDRLVVIHKVSLIQPLPFSYKERLAAIEGVERLTWANWFGGIYQEPKNFFPQMAVDPESWLAVYPETVLDAEERARWLGERTGAIVGKSTAERFGWKVGDRVPIQGTIYRPKEGGLTWEFTISGIYEAGVKGYDTTQLFFHYDYLAENAVRGEGLVGWYVIDLVDPQAANEVAKTIDSRFANSSAETKTSTEKAFVQAFANQAGNIAAIVRGIVAVVFFTMLLVAGNTMAQSVRERTSELGVLKTIGYTDGQVMALVLAESLTLAVVGGGAGLALVTWITSSFEIGGSMLPAFFIPPSAVATGAVLVVVMGLVAGAIPAYQALRLKIVDALARRT